jgi:hypothetical protein
MIVIFEEHMSTLSLHMAGVQAWKIYQYFVAPGSAFEVCVMNTPIFTTSVYAHISIHIFI